MLTVFVVYNLPDRDCAASASAGELSGGEAGLERYTREFIEPLAEIVRGFPEQRVAFMLEPDSLPNLVSSTWSERCRAARKTYVRGIARAIGSLAPLGAVYVDVGNAQWCQWFVEDLAKMLVEILRLAGPAAAQVLRARRRHASQAQGSIHYSRPRARPRAAPRLRDGCEQLRRDVDRVRVCDAADPRARAARVLGVALRGRHRAQRRREARGRRGHVVQPPRCGRRDAGDGGDRRRRRRRLLWIKPPGESDGVSTPFSPRYDAACGGASSLSDAPQAGEWFHEGFVMLAKNAHPPWDAARVYDPQVTGQPLPPPSPPPPPGRGDGGGDDGGRGGGTTSSAIGLNVAPSPPGHDYDYDDLLRMFAVPPAPPPPPPSAPSPPPPPPTYGVIHVTDAVINGGSGDGDGVGGGGHRAHRDDGDHEFARLRYSPPPPAPHGFNPATLKPEELLFFFACACVAAGICACLACRRRHRSTPSQSPSPPSAMASLPANYGAPRRVKVKPPRKRAPLASQDAHAKGQAVDSRGNGGDEELAIPAPPSAVDDDGDDPILFGEEAAAEPAAAEDAAPPMIEMQPSDVRSVGERVEVRGLVGRPELNGRCGSVVGFDAAKGRYIVIVGEEQLSLKSSNLVAAAEEEGNGPLV